MQNLVEKQRIFAALYETVMEQETPHKGLLLRGDSSDLQQGEMLLRGAIHEGTSSGHSSLLWLRARVALCFVGVKRKLRIFFFSFFCLQWKICRTCSSQE